MNEERSKECVERLANQLTKQIDREGVTFFTKQYVEIGRNEVTLYYNSPNYQTPQRCNSARNYREMELIIGGLTGFPYLIERLDKETGEKTNDN
jgi:hypothetical protein